MTLLTLQQLGLACLFFLLACEQPPARKKVTITTLQPEKPVASIIPVATCTYDNAVSTLGIGLVIVPTKFEVFNDSLLKERWMTGDLSSGDSSLARVCPKFYKPDYGIMHFVCVGKTSQSYRVLINYKEEKYLPKTTTYHFKTWEAYIMESFGVSFASSESERNASAQPLRTAPAATADTLSLPEGRASFCPVRLQGDWLQVNYDCFYNQDDNPHEGTPCHQYISECKTPLTGWLRWRKDQHLLIDIFRMP
jgi:hypothetical protein